MPQNEVTVETDLGARQITRWTTVNKCPGGNNSAVSLSQSKKVAVRAREEGVATGRQE